MKRQVTIIHETDNLTCLHDHGVRTANPACWKRMKAGADIEFVADG